MKVVRNYFINLGYQLLILLAPLLTIPYVSRVLGPENVGINAYTNSVMTYFLIVATFGLNMYGMNKIKHLKDEKARSKLFWEIELLQILMVVIALASYMILTSFAARFRPYFWLQAISLVAVAFDISWYFIGTHDYQKTIMRNTTIRILGIVFIFFLVKTENDLGTYILVTALAGLIGNLSLWPALRRNLVKIDWGILTFVPHLKPAFMLLLPTVASQIYMMINRTLLGKLDAISASGYFDYGSRLVMVLIAIVTAVSQVMMPLSTKRAKNGDMAGLRHDLIVGMDTTTGIGVGLAFGIAAISPQMPAWLLGLGYEPVSQLLMIIAPAVILIGWSNVLGQQYLLVTGKTAAYTWALWAGVFFNISFDFILIPWFGLNGAAYGLLISEIMIVIWQLILVHREVAVPRLFPQFWKYLVAGALMFGVVHYLNVEQFMNAHHLLLQMGIGVVIYLLLVVILNTPLINRLRNILLSAMRTPENKA